METTIQAAMAVTALIGVAVLAIAMPRYRHQWTVQFGHSGILLKDGKVVTAIGPGKHIRWGTGFTMETLDQRPQVLTVPGQEILTSDGLPIRLSVIVEIAIVDPVKYLTAHSNSGTQCYVLVQVAMREAVASVSADDLIENRGSIDEALAERCRSRFAELGVELKEIQLRDITFPGEIKSIMTAVVRARKEGLAALEKARGESAALRNLANSARILQENPGLMQLRLLQALSESKGSVLVLNGESQIVPLPQQEKG